ncbi:phosphate-starvation-inducible PsiE family protein [Aneurinibacillus sp. Ricciae_BoGa-3]|uniref:phosphate-starvation-inducible PsiE family protein n=1 Tax=Aneurinibacillus sp. Ricciae_BoGa-3 TaxID=3022697 RepID=UPI002341CEAE|nr:phosphate-starvation-inducible PsiE family protein [Aneurinibacillus sp. Ricciae_BoGa-3]WCK53246.1 phosphate-starvation-inducible PsiE family protein [Aneurinibacillus sp. Ricciae_BoGa-3]
MNQSVIKFFQWFLNLSLIALGLVLVIFMVREVWIVLQYAMAPLFDVRNILQDMLMFFLFFAFLSTIVTYFKEKYHFPIRYLLYIGITATLRFIIVNRDDPVANLILSVVILVLMISYSLKIRNE